VSEEVRLDVGQILAGRYWLQEHLGRGQMGDVFRARHTKVPRDFAVKVLHPQLVSDPKVCARFEREAEIAGRLRHRNVISVIDIGETSHSRYIVMDLALGPNLAQLIGEGPMPARRVIHLAMQICDGLHHAHEADLIHRDLKPENVIIELEGELEVAKIVDFGLAIVREGAGEGSDRLTTRGIVLGTPHYLAPETAMGKPLDRRADLFALGVMLFEMLTGAMPFPGDGVQVATANVGAPTPTMASRAPDVTVDPLLEALVRKLLAKRPEDRFATAFEVRELLRLIAADRDAATAILAPASDVEAPVSRAFPGPEHEVATDEVLPLGTQRRSRIVMVATGAVLLLVAGLAGFALRPPAPAAGSKPVVVAEPPPLIPPVPPAPAPVPEAVPAPVPPPAEVVVAARPPVPPRRAEQAPVAIATPVAPVEPTVETPPAHPDALLHLYASLGKQLKRISDRRDLSADDLWVRYRRIRIQAAITSSASRAAAMNVLMAIERELETRYRSPVL